MFKLIIFVENSVVWWEDQKTEMQMLSIQTNGLGMDCHYNVNNRF